MICRSWSAAVPPEQDSQEKHGHISIIDVEMMQEQTGVM
jgi:hypothetical protein